ncbi:hypothetical protein M0L20_22900 [Spirosoma sp. RP8]|uniref:UbiA prenyltransferase family protein n=1 Tax=Spirosoma liriopis TaxID=2937440 RepID=A0ABT0HRD3_9BACT|nr:hypothetical protein [Spirosoma liriopis]MCK8494736.1 hypothetical protein [Spirosoma liriopis]
MVEQARRLGKSLLEFILFSNGYIALCAVVMCQATAILFQRELPAFFLPFIFVATVSSYSLHWYLTPTTLDSTERNQWNRRHKLLLIGIGIGSALVALVLFTQLVSYYRYFIPIVVATLLYTAPKIDRVPFRYLRRVAILKTAYLALVWTLVTGVLPIVLTGPGWNMALTVWAINRFLFLYSICFWFDYRDRVADRRSRWLTIVSMMNPKRAATVFYGIASCFALTLILLLQHGMSFPKVIALSLPMCFLAGSVPYIPHWSSDYWYYVYLDGLLLLSGLTLLAAESFV